MTLLDAGTYERVRQGLPMPGVFEIQQDVSIGVAIEEVLILAECSIEGVRERLVTRSGGLGATVTSVTSVTSHFVLRKEDVLAADL